MERLQRITLAIRDIPDFPKPGIIFKDITPILKDPKLFDDTICLLAESIGTEKIDYVAGIEARGFIFGGALAAKLDVGFIPIRKPGKLPYKTYSESYDLEYGTDALEIHQDAVEQGSSVLIVDDLLATGGTANAAAKLVENCGGNIKAILFVIELSFLNGLAKISDYRVESLIKY